MGTNQDEKIEKMTFASVFPHYQNKVKRKGQSLEDLDLIVQWLTGLNQNQLNKCIEQKLTFKELFEIASIPSNAFNIKGSICGIKVQEISNPLTQKVRFLDKIVDDLAKGKSVEKIISI